MENPQLSGPGRIARDNNQKKRGGALIEVRCSHRGSDRRTSLSTPAARPTKQTISGKKPKIFVRGSIDSSGSKTEIYALALQAALWSGIVDSDKARQTVERLMVPDMFNGWGVRALSENERALQPDRLSLGHRMAHDNSINFHWVPALRIC